MAGLSQCWPSVSAKSEFHHKLLLPLAKRSGISAFPKFDFSVALDTNVGHRS